MLRYAEQQNVVKELECENHVEQNHKDCLHLQKYKRHYIPKDTDVRPA